LLQWTGNDSLNAHPENKKYTVKPTVHANRHDNFYDIDQCRNIFSIHEIKMKQCRLNKWQGKTNFCSKLTWSLSNSFFSTACAPNARMVVRPCNDALRWENTGLRAENKFKHKFKNILPWKMLESENYMTKNYISKVDKDLFDQWNK